MGCLWYSRKAFRAIIKKKIAGHSHLLQASEQCFCIYIYMRVSMVFKEGFSSHYQEKIAGHTHLLQASEQCVCIYIYIYIYMCVCLWYSRKGFRPIIKKK